MKTTHDRRALVDAAQSAAAIILITLIGGRVVPAFTRNWLATRGSEALPAEFGRLDTLALALTVLTLPVWIAVPPGSRRPGTSCSPRVSPRPRVSLAGEDQVPRRTPGLGPPCGIRVRAARHAGFVGGGYPAARLGPASRRPARGAQPRAVVADPAPRLASAAARGTARYPDVSHPLVRTHPVNGRNALYVGGNMAVGVEYSVRPYRFITKVRRLEPWSTA